jgi:hypothetical protein
MFPEGCFSPLLATKGDHKDVFILSVLTARNSAARRGSFHFISRPFIYLSLEFLPGFSRWRIFSNFVSLGFSTARLDLLFSLARSRHEVWSKEIGKVDEECDREDQAAPAAKSG